MNKKPKLFLELEAIKWEFNLHQEFDRTSYHTVERVQQQMYEKDHILEALSSMTDEERCEIIHEFCVHCGSTNKDCQCSNLKFILDD